MGEGAVITASAPGSLMLLGEHAVLHGHHALVCSINRRITIRLRPADDDSLRIRSALGDYHAPLSDLADHGSFRFLIQTVQQHLDRLPGGFELEVESDFSADIGFGSSAAVTVAAHAALLRWIHHGRPTPDTLFSESLRTVHQVQGRGSGADLAAAVYGGIVSYCTRPSFSSMNMALPLTAVYSGYKTPTVDVILQVEQMRAKNPARFARIYAAMDDSVLEAVEALRTHDLKAFGHILNRNHLLMDEMGISTPELNEIVADLQTSPDIFGAKISGSGLGDCAIGIGIADASAFRYPVHHLEIIPAGCQLHD